MNIFDKITNYKFKNGMGLVNLTDEFFALYVKKLFQEEKNGILIVTPSLYEGSKISAKINNYVDSLLFQVDDLVTSSTSSYLSPYLKFDRVSVINDLIHDKKRIVVTDLNGYLKKISSPSSYKNNIISIKKDDNFDRDNLVSKLIDMGYEKTSIVTKTGEFAVRGFVIDVFLIDHENPIRIEFFGDTIDSLRHFSPDSQTSIDDLGEVSIIPCNDSMSDSSSNILSYLDDPIVIYKDYDMLETSYNHLLEDLSDVNDVDICDFHSLNPSKLMYYFDFDSNLSLVPDNLLVNFGVSGIEKFNEDIAKINDYIKSRLKYGKTLIFSLPTINVNKFIDQLEVPVVITTIDDIKDNCVNVVKQPMSEGFSVLSYIFITEYELFNKKGYKEHKNKFRFANRLKDLSKIEKGDYVVHYTHGIGIYNGIKTLKKNGVLCDYIEVLYSHGDKLYIPASKIELLSKYSSKEGYVPKINSLNSTSWEKTKQRVREKIRYEAERLIKVQAMRSLSKGIAFSKDTPLQQVFESEFLFDETPDQLKVVEQIKRDMESPIPMDRIVCGDVGYGKTEVAFRAMFKAVMDSKQVLYLCPTTLLSKQQYESAIERFKNYPINIGILNRFTSPKETKRILSLLSSGKIDIVFGTHRLLSDDVKPSNLGLLVIDEEQRFGVAHKEKIKEFKNNIDVLTLTATPIPRTLQMSMLGLRNLSLLETPPKNRKSIQTYVVGYDERLIRNIVYKEMSRGGQVFILYNKVEDIELKKERLSKIIPDAKIIVAHGQLSKIELENRINSFVSGEYDVLLCTTIIETGMDIPNVNSLIILDASNFGLSQLYQIRGRVGRSDRQAYAYLMYDKHKVLTETAIKRLKVIKDYTELGSGFTIATRDLSIRGAGDILGAEQAGFIDSVGIDLYMKMLNDEVFRLKGEEIPEEQSDEESSIISANHIDDNYVSDEDLKIEIHKMINEIDSKDKFDKVKNELEDRFGSLSEDLIIYMNVELFEKLIKNVGVRKVNDNNIYVELIIDSKHSKDIDYEKLFVSSLKISNKFSFKYINNEFYIKLLKSGLDRHYIYYLNELLERI